MHKTTKIWNNVYKVFEKNESLGISYPTEALVVYVSNLRKKKNNYFDDTGKESSIKKFYKGKALEVGFGSVANLIMLQEKGYECFGAEVSNEAVRKGKLFIKKKRLSKKINLKIFKKNKLCYPANNFDLVVGLQCVYYNVNIKKFLNDEIFKVLKPGGKFIFSFFAKDHTYQRYTEVLRKDVSCFGKKHPNKRLVGAEFYNPLNKKNLLDKFKIFKNVKIFYTKSNQTIFKESWWYVVGEK